MAFYYSYFPQITLNISKKLVHNSYFMYLACMATIKAVVRKTGGKIKTNQQGEALIYMQYGHDGKSFTINTGVKIPPEAWKGEKNQSNPVGGETAGRAKRNSTIARYRRQLEDAKDRVLTKGLTPSTDAVKRELTDQNKKPKVVDLFSLWEEYIVDSSIKKTESTCKQIASSLSTFRDYWKGKTPGPMLENIDITFYDKYVRFLQIKRNLNNNSVGKQIKTLKSFLNYLRDRGYTISPDVSKFKVFKERTSVVYLTQQELTQLYEYHFPNERLSRVRDLFVFQASTGLRWSDLSRLAPEHIQDGIIKMTAYKNKKPTIVPLIPRARVILAKYDGKLPIIAEQNVNLYIKEACMIAGIDQPIERVIYHGGKKTFKTVPKCREISTHKAVATFITHCGERGVSPKVVSEITGKTVKVILDHYYGINNETIISAMTKAFEK